MLHHLLFAGAGDPGPDKVSWPGVVSLLWLCERHYLRASGESKCDWSKESVFTLTNTLVASVCLQDPPLLFSFLRCLLEPRWASPASLPLSFLASSSHHFLLCFREGPGPTLCPDQDLHELLLGLMCQFDPQQLLTFLHTSQHYRLEEAILVCVPKSQRRLLSLFDPLFFTGLTNTLFRTTAPMIHCEIHILDSICAFLFWRETMETMGFKQMRVEFGYKLVGESMLALCLDLSFNSPGCKVVVSFFA